MASPIAQPADWRDRFAGALRDPEVAPPDGLFAWNGSDPERRFAVYRNNVAVGLVDALCDTFPVCQELVGEEYFRAMAHVFVRRQPPASRILSEYGAGFPAFVADFEPAQEIAYLADVARLEYARIEACHAADATSLAVETWAAFAPEQLAALRVRPHPSARTIASAHAVFSLWAAHQGMIEIGAVDPGEAEEVLVLRPALDVETISLPPGGAAFFAALAQGHTLGEAAAAAGCDAPEFDLATNLSILVASGFAVEAATTP